MEQRRTVIICTSNKCNFSCSGREYGCVAGCQRLSCDKESVVDMAQAFKWIQKFIPGCDIHITGGEPFVLPGITNDILKFANAGHKTSVFTNGSLLSKNPEAYSLPVAWQITHHYRQISIGNFFENIDPLMSRPHVLCRILGKKEKPSDSIAAVYSDFNFKWIRDRAGFIDYQLKDKWPLCPNDSMLLMGIQGEIYSCSAPNRQYGSIYDMTFDYESTSDYVCPGGYPDNCQACQSIEILKSLHEQMLLN